VRSLILQAIAHGKATGVAVAVVHGGSIVWEEGFGWANREARVKATAHTPFTMASITKPFTATTLMILAAEGKLSLDDSANKYLTNSRIQGMNGSADAVTVRRLGAHVSGLPTMFEGYDRDEATLVLASDALIRNYGRLVYPPRTCYEYSNIGFAALAVIASNLAGTDFGTLMTQRVLTPLGLHDSFFDTKVARLPMAPRDTISRAIQSRTTQHPLPLRESSTPAFTTSRTLQCST